MKKGKSTKKTSVSLLYLSPETTEYLHSQVSAIKDKNGGRVGLATVARAVLSGLMEAKFDLSSCRGELDINDMVRRLAEVK